MNAATQARHGSLADFLTLTDGLSVAKIAEILHCCARSVRNWIAGRSPIPWHRIELLRLRAAESAAAAALTAAVADTVPVPDVVANIDPALTEPDVPAHELIAWVGVHSPNFLSSKLSFERYVRGWRVVEKIRRAKAEGSFARVLAQWRVVALDLPKHQRSGGMFAATGPPAYFKR
ncbi:IS21 family transposase [Burkholderia sp. ISTR5]|uniref:IS21 family transposase n=1 Tax=Burkholderia sp. ISTR5 TaxID=2500161 RepID=UPI00191C261B|nr:IS21 family transposase [Burkholderia sp. ISTR5]